MCQRGIEVDIPESSMFAITRYTSGQWQKVTHQVPAVFPAVSKLANRHHACIIQAHRHVVTNSAWALLRQVEKPSISNVQVLARMAF